MFGKIGNTKETITELNYEKVGFLIFTSDLRVVSSQSDDHIEIKNILNLARRSMNSLNGIL